MELLETPLTNLTPFLPFFTESLDSGVKMVESTPLRDRMAMYQAAVTKHDFPSSPTVSDNPPPPPLTINTPSVTLYDVITYKSPAVLLTWHYIEKSVIVYSFCSKPVWLTSFSAFFPIKNEQTKTFHAT